jgi:hypothetical protein
LVEAKAFFCIPFMVVQMPVLRELFNVFDDDGNVWHNMVSLKRLFVVEKKCYSLAVLQFGQAHVKCRRFTCVPL